jgi:hypothetical protein
MQHRPPSWMIREAALAVLVGAALHSMATPPYVPASLAVPAAAQVSAK